MMRETEDAVAQPAANPVAAQIGFLELAVTAAEGHLRAFDTKAQIALAAFVLSWTPLLAMLHGACRPGLAPGPSAVLATVVVTILCYGRTVWPSAPPPAAGPGLFFLPRDAVVTPAELVGRIARASLAEELAGEVLKLTALRERKVLFLRIALGSTVCAYAVFLALLITGAQCA